MINEIDRIDGFDGCIPAPRPSKKNRAADCSTARFGLHRRLSLAGCVSPAVCRRLCVAGLVVGDYRHLFLRLEDEVAVFHPHVNVVA